MPQCHAMLQAVLLLKQRGLEKKQARFYHTVRFIREQVLAGMKQVVMCVSHGMALEKTTQSLVWLLYNVSVLFHFFLLLGHAWRYM